MYNFGVFSYISWEIRANVDLNCPYQNVSVPLQVISVLFFLICTPGNTHSRAEWTKHLVFSFLSTKLRWRIVSILMVTVTHLTIVCWEWCDEGVSSVHVYSGLYDCSSLALHCWLGLSGLSLPTAVVTILWTSVIITLRTLFDNVEGGLIVSICSETCCYHHDIPH